MMLRDFLQLVGLSRSMVKVLKHEGGQILVDQNEVTVRKILAEDQSVEVVFPPEQRGTFLQPEPISLAIVYEDDHVIVIEKSANMASIPSVHHQTGTVANGLIYHYDKQGLDYTVHIVTRLDRDTSGLMLVAKHRFSHSLLAGVKIDRTYQAIVEGKLLIDSGTIDAPIARKETSIIERMVTPNGKRALTHYRTLQTTRFGTLVEVVLETGRTHQIRVHFAHLGHPLLGDDLYGGTVDQLSRQALHCTAIRFIHPVTKKSCSFSSKLADDLVPHLV